MRTSRSAALFLFPVAMFQLLLSPSPADASWTEGGATILSLDELLPRIGGALGGGTLAGSVGTSLPGDTPVLLPLDADPDSPKTIQIALVQSGLALRAQAGGWNVVGASDEPEAARARTRLRTVVSLAPRPNQPDRVTTGGVVLFGEVVAPPYLVEVAGDAVEINGVAVFPVLGADVTPPEPTAVQVDTHDRMDAAVRNYGRNTGALGIAEAKRSLIGELSRLPGVTGAEWLDDENVRITHADGEGQILTLTQDGRDLDPPTTEQQRAAIETQAGSIRAALGDGATVFCGATYLLIDSSLDAAVLRGRIEQILRSGESDLLKIARLQAYTGHRDAAADLLYARAR